MPSLDLSEALFEPSFLDQFVVKRRRQVMDQYGIAAITTQLIAAFGTVTTSSGNDLKRGADEQHAEKNIHIVTSFRLRGATVGYQPDLVTWHGDDFLVKKVEDYTGYGIGWVQVECASIDFMDQPPPSRAGLDFADPNNSGLAGAVACYCQ